MFKYVLVHGLVRDSDGRKMSKSLGNGIDPLGIIDEYGADALRFMLINGNTAGNDMRFQTEKLDSSRNFANKLWNASRFVIMNLKDEDGNLLEFHDDIEDLELKNEDRWILSRINAGVKEITANMDKFELSLAVQKIYELIWNEFCDWYIELVKSRLYGDDENEKMIVRTVLMHGLSDILRLLHPFMPFITEEIWSFLGKDGKLISDIWPEYKSFLNYSEAEDTIESAMSVIKSIRNIRAEADAAPSRKLSACIIADQAETEKISAGEEHIKKLSNITEISYSSSREDAPKESATAVIEGAEIFVPLDELLDYEAEKERLKKEKGKLEGEIKRLEGKLNNQGFVDKAPEKVVTAEKEKLKNYQEMYEKAMDRWHTVKNK